jgi:SAM-dependent MidA family methyltransferase
MNDRDELKIHITDEKIMSGHSTMPIRNVLEIGSGDGLVLERILTDERNKKHPTHYTCVEPCETHKNAIQNIIRNHSKNKDIIRTL